MKRLLSIGIILLFIGMTISSSTGFNVKEQSHTPTSNGKTLYVGGSGPGNYTKIQDAIDDANDGDTVFVYNGTYYENLDINKTINLYGENRDTTIIDGGNWDDDVVFIFADWVNISNFTIKNGYYGIWLYNSNNITISDNIISKNAYGIDILHSNSTNVSGNIFSGCAYGVFGYYSNSTYIISNIFSKNIWGIVIYSSCKNKIVANDIISTDWGGISQYWTSNNIILNNNISNNGWGINLTGSYNDIISGNIISNTNWREGIKLVGCNNTNITGNIISEIEVEGIKLGGCRSIIITRNIISKNSKGIYSGSTSNNNLFYHNNFINNTQNAYDEGYNSWDDGYPSGGNYWDDYTGKDSDGDGIGDTPYPIDGGDNEDRYPLMEPYSNWSYYPFAKFTWTPHFPGPYTPVIFNASDSFDLDGYITLYEWDWDNDGEYDENHSVPTATHFWEDVGDFPVTLRITDNDSLTGLKTKYVRVWIGPVEPPAIFGPTCGKVGIEYEYTFVQTSPEGYDICYFIDWGDNTTTGWTDYYEAGERIIRNHSWCEKGDYKIKAKVKDIYSRESDWAILEVAIPKNRNVFFSHWLERYPILNQIIIRVMERWNI